MVITFSTQKGGAGKTTLSLHLAHVIALAKKRVLLVDADPQASAGNWSASRDDKPPFAIVGMAQNTLHRDLPEIAKDYDHVVIDSPPRVSALARSAILAADLVLIPVQPSSYDVWAAGETVELVREAQGFKPDIKAAFLINRKITNTAIAEDVRTALADYPFPTFKTAISQRVAFAESSAGYTVLETALSGLAAKEIQTLAKEILKFMGVKTW